MRIKDVITDNRLPVSPSSDQNQMSPCNINARSIREVMRIKDVITDDKLPVKSQ